ncbi:type VII secretion protein EccB [Saccharopolyspora sp. 5N102]|uniref:type VII secretion protein EccB n=1 Tax=Saccharopolyspora sp. 5N102 TaxID=3375155 RepID=UPI003791AEDD
MRSRRDQVQAYFFVVGRLISALLSGRPDDPNPPTRRFTVNAIIGCLVAALVVVVFGIAGVISPGANNSWRSPGSIIVEKETGAKYLYLAGSLRPVLNFASARLIVNSLQANVVSVSSNSLRDVPRGLPLGIPNAPDSLPGPDALTRAPWFVCADTSYDKSNTPSPVTEVQVREIAGAPLRPDSGLLVSTPDGMKYLVWRGTRFRIPQQAVIDALGYGAVRPLPVASSWVQALPSGPDLAAADVPGLGNPAFSVKGETGRVGQVYEVHDPVLGDDRFYVLLQDGLAPLSRTGAGLLLADPDLAAAYPGSKPGAVEIDAAAVGSVPRSALAAVPPELPVDPPKITPVDRNDRDVPCARFAVGSGGEVPVEVVMVRRDEARFSGVIRSPQPAGALAFLVSVPPTFGVLARDLPAPGAPAGARYLITDLGIKYPLPGPDSLGALGYAGVDPLPVPSELLALLPDGVALAPGTATEVRPGD